jgi:hypothetical protein
MSDGEKRKAGRPLKGTLVWTRDRRRQAIVTLGDGSRKRLEPFPRGISEALAREKAAFYAEKWAHVHPKPPVGETAATGSVAAWFEQFAKHREARGLTSVRDDRGRFARHVAPVLGPLRMETVSRADVERLVRALDAKVQAGELSWKTSQNTWVLVSKNVPRVRALESTGAPRARRQPVRGSRPA